MNTNTIKNNNTGQIKKDSYLAQACTPIAILREYVPFFWK